MKISIVVCAYNAEKWLNRCIDSVISQTHSNWELWIIDDGSIDNTAKIVQQYTEQDHRIHLHSQENQGLSSARKAGIKCAQGEYLTFIDADDYVGELYLEHLLEPLHQHPKAQCIKGGHLRFENGNITKVAAPEISHFSPSEAITLSYHPKPIWAMLWKSSFMKHHIDCIPEHLNLAEDIVITLQLYPHLKSVYFSPYADYHYFIHGANMSYVQFPLEKLLQVLTAFIKSANLDYWKNSDFVFSHQFYLLARLLRDFTRSSASTSDLVSLLQRLPAPLLSVQFLKRSNGYGAYFYTWLLKHRWYRLLIYLAKIRFK